MMVTSCLAALGILQPTANPVMNLLAEHGFTSRVSTQFFSDDLDPNISMGAFHPQDDLLVSIDVMELKQRTVSNLVETIVSMSQTNTYRNQVLDSGLPIGAGTERKHYLGTFGGSFSRVIAGTEGWAVTGSLIYSSRRENGKLLWGKGDKDRHRAVFEMVLRLALAEAAAGGFSDGKRYARLPALASSTALSKWLAGRGVSAKVRPHIAQSFTYRGKQIIIPLAANKMKVGDRWIPFAGIVGHRNGEWQLPSDAVRILDSL
jgi:hypothetical protein